MQQAVTRNDLSHMAGLMLALVLFYFVVQVASFPATLRPDEYKALDFFVGGMLGEWTPANEIFTRLVILGANLTTLAALYRMRLISPETLVLACLWPMTIFLFSKIYWEFFVFPLCLIRHDLSARGELGLLAFFAAVLGITGEANIAVMMLFRAVLLGQKLGMRRLAPLGFLGAGVALNWAMSLGIAASLPVIGGHLARFSWTRNIVNPEYSVPETVAIFLTSFHFFTLHTGLWWIDALLSVAVLAAIFTAPGAGARLQKNWPTVLAFGCVVIGMTEITHAFQNARYYFFYLPLVAALAPPQRYVPIGLIGFVHVALKSSEVFWID